MELKPSVSAAVSLMSTLLLYFMTRCSSPEKAHIYFMTALSEISECPDDDDEMDAEARREQQLEFCYKVHVHKMSKTMC